MNIKEQIYAEIERLNALDYPCDTAEEATGFYNALDRVLSFLDSLPEQPVEDLNELIRKWDRVNINTILKAKVKATGDIIDGFYDGRGHFDHFVDHDIFDRYSIEDVEPIIDEQPVELLEEEIEKRYEQAKWGYVDGFGATVMDKGQFIRIARHFAEWGAEHLKR